MKITWDNTVKHPYIEPYLRPDERHLGLRQCGKCGGALIMHGLTKGHMKPGETLYGGELVCPNTQVYIPPEEEWLHHNKETTDDR
jgi:hypothetical protein